MHNRSKSNDRNKRTPSQNRDKTFSLFNINKMNTEIMELSKELEELGNLS